MSNGLAFLLKVKTDDGYEAVAGFGKGNFQKTLSEVNKLVEQYGFDYAGDFNGERNYRLRLVEVGDSIPDPSVIGEVVEALEAAAEALDNAGDDLANLGDYEAADWRRTQADHARAALAKVRGEVHK